MWRHEVAATGAQAAALQSVTPERYEIDVRFEPERSFLHARAEVTLRAGQFLEAIEFELNPHLEILEVTDGLGRRLEFVRDRDRHPGSPKLLVRLAEPCGAEQGVTIAFTYEGTLPRGRLDYITPQGILLRDESRWYPATDLSAFAESVILVRLPLAWHAVASSDHLPLDDREAFEGVVFYARDASSRSVAAHPVAPLWECLETVEARERPWARENIAPSVAFCTNSNEEHRRYALAHSLQLIRDEYEQRFGELAYGRVDYLSGFPSERGAMGYSAPGFLVVSEDVVRWHGYPGWAPEFLPHEIAHQWFPIEVTPAREEDGWLAESLAEYLAWRYLEEHSPGDARRMVERALREAPAADPPRPLRRGLHLFHEGWDVAYAALYQRGMLVWRTLEAVIGRSRVDAALREYYEHHRGRSAAVEDFQRIAEEISSRELDWFFRYYLDSTELPEIELRRLPAAAPGEVSGEILVRNVPEEFTVRVEMTVHTADGPVEHSVATRGARTPFTVSVASPATSITLEPRSRILRWTEPARRHRAQRALLAQVGALEEEGKYDRAADLCLEALDADPGNLTGNHQQIYFQLARLHLRMGSLLSAQRNFDYVFRFPSPDPVEDEFYRAWARVFRARIAAQQDDTDTARREAASGLSIGGPALEQPARWPGADGEQTARAALEQIRR